MADKKRQRSVRRNHHRRRRRRHDGRRNGRTERQEGARNRKDGEGGPQDPHHGQGALQPDQRPPAGGVRRAGAHQRRFLRDGIRRIQQPRDHPLLRTAGPETRLRTRRPRISPQRQGVGRGQHAGRVVPRQRRGILVPHARDRADDARRQDLRRTLHEPPRLRTQGRGRTGDRRHGRRLLPRHRLDGRRLHVRQRGGARHRTAASVAHAARLAAPAVERVAQVAAAQHPRDALHRRRSRTRGVRRDRILGTRHRRRCG